MRSITSLLSISILCCSCSEQSARDEPAAAGAGGLTASTGGGSSLGGGAAGGSTGTSSGIPGNSTLLGAHVLTWYSFQDNTPSNSSMSASARQLVPYLSVALPFRFLEQFGGTIAYGDELFVEFLAGRTMPNGVTHSGWVKVDDFCGDNQDDSYCYQSLGGQLHPNIDLWIGDFTASGLDPATCQGPAGSGQELTNVYTGSAGAAWIADYGGRSVGVGKCGDSAAARAEQPNCWYYTPPPESAEWCSSCSAVTCAP